jgi:DNA polymerase-3 subunit epsilon
MKEVFFDVETSGTDYKKHGILQLAGIIKIKGQEMDRFNMYMKPFGDQAIESSALEANGITLERIKDFDEPYVAYSKFVKLMDRYIDRYNKQDKMHLIGYNSRFDDNFLREWFVRNGNKFYGSYYWWPSIDVSNMVAVKYRKYRHQFPNFQLMTVAEKLKIVVDREKAHDAMYDTDVTMAIYDKVIAE